jgi:hypothetical protein
MSIFLTEAQVVILAEVPGPDGHMHLKQCFQQEVARLPTNIT